MKNTQKRLVSNATYILAHAKHPYFKLGYDDYMKDRPFNYDTNLQDGYMYERGRAFAIFTKVHKQPKASWRNGTLSKAAGERLLSAAYMHFVI